MKNVTNSATLLRLESLGAKELSNLFEKQREHLRWMVNKRIAGPLAARFDASDVIQEAYIRATKQLDGYLASPRVHPLAWVRLICKQLLSEHVRKNLRGIRNPNQEQSPGSDLYLAESLAASIDSVSDRAAKEELIAELNQVLENNLDQTDREIIEMRHAEDLSFSQIADQFEISKDAIKKRYYRALDEIREALSLTDLIPS